MKNNICSTCKYWNAPETLEDWFENWGTCECSKILSSYTINTRDNNISSDSMITENYEGWGFFTGPDFGCIHHKLKEINNENQNTNFTPAAQR